MFSNLIIPAHTIDLLLSGIWLLISLVSVLIGIGLALSRMGRAGTFMYLGGLLMLAFSVFRVHPALVRAPLSDEVVELRETLIALRTERDQERAARAADLAKLATKDGQLKAAAQRVSSLEKAAESSRRSLDTVEEESRRALEAQSVATRSAIQQSNARAKVLREVERQATALRASLQEEQAKLLLEQIMGRATQHTLGETLGALAASTHDTWALVNDLNAARRALDQERALQDGLRRDLSAQEAILTTSKRKLAELQQKLDAAPIVPDALPPVEQPSPDLRAALELGVSKPHYTVRRYAGGQLLKSQTGPLYAVTLTKPATGAPFIFKSRQFSLGDDEASFLEAFKLFSIEVIDKLKGAGTLELLIRGRADRGGAIGPLPPVAQKFQKVRYFSAVAGGYEDRNLEQTIVGNIENAHLPILRAASVRDALVRAGSQSTIIILEGLTASSTDETQRAVDIFLHIVVP